MFNLSSLKNIGIPLYLLVYLIFPYSAITQNTESDFRANLERALNSRNLDFFKQSFKKYERKIILEQFSRITKEFPDSKWQIKISESTNPNEDIFKIKVVGTKISNEEKYVLESNFNYVFSMVNGKIKQGNIKKLFTTIRNDNKKIDITFRIPDEVLTGAEYDIDIILNKPLEGVIIAGGIKSHQVDSIFEQEISLEPLVSGGIFKMTRAPSKPGIQIWSGIIAHPKGMITFTKSIDIIDKI